MDLEALAAKAGERVVTLADVERAAGTAVPATPPSSNAMRAAIGAAMTRSWHEIPHYHVGCDIVVEGPLRALEAFNRERPINERVLFAVVLLRAVAQAVRDTPTLNGWFDNGEFRPAAAVHLGVVTSLRNGVWWCPPCTMRNGSRWANGWGRCVPCWSGLAVASCAAPTWPTPRSA